MVRKETPNPNISFLVQESYGTIAAGATQMICARPQCEVIKPYKLFIDQHIAKHFVINDIRVGNRSMFPAAQNLDATQFSVGDGHEMKVDPIMISQDFIIQVTNISGQCSAFRANWACYLPREVARVMPFPKMSRRRAKPIDLVDAFTDNFGVGDTPEQIEPAFEEQKTQPINPHLKHIKPNPRFGWDPGYDD